MRILLIFDAATADCFTRLEKATLIGDSLTVLTVDSVVIGGIRPMINRASSVLYMKVEVDSVAVNDVVIPFENISRLTYRKPSDIRRGLILLGLCTGIVAGALTGEALVDEPAGWFELESVQFFGALIGGFIGAIAGHEIGRHFTSTVTLECR